MKNYCKKNMAGTGHYMKCSFCKRRFNPASFIQYFIAKTSHLTHCTLSYFMEFVENKG